MDTNYSALEMSLAKSHQKYWEERLKQRSFTRANGEKYVSSEYSVRISVGGKPERFNLDSANKNAAAGKARDIWLFARSHTRDEVLLEFKHKSAAPETGIYAASTALGHGNITTTAASYLDKKGKGNNREG